MSIRSNKKFQRIFQKIAKPVGTLTKSLVGQTEGGQRWKTLPVTTKSQGGWEVLGPCQWRPYSFWLPWINLLAGELWGEGRSGGISSAALLWLSTVLSARTHTHDKYVRTHTHTHHWRTECDVSAHLPVARVKTHLTGWETEREWIRTGKRSVEYLSYLSFLPRRWWHCSLLIPVECRQKETAKLTHQLLVRQGPEWSGWVTFRLSDTQSSRLTLTPSGGLCTTVLWDSCDAEQSGQSSTS